MNTVLEFPKTAIFRETPELEEHLNIVRERSRQKHAETATQEIVGELYDHLDEFEIFDLEDPTFKKDFFIVSDMIRALVYRTYDVDHHLHGFIDDHVVIQSVDNVTPEEIANVSSEMYGDGGTAG